MAQTHTKTRTTVVLDDDLVERAKVVSKTDSTTAAITFALTEMVRRANLERLASLMGTETDFGDVTPRRRPPEFTNAPAPKEAK